MAVAENRVVTADVRAQLLAGFLRKHGFAADQIAGTSPGSVFYAYVSSTNTYWAATFVASSTATEQTGVNMQDGGAEATFTRIGTGAWDVRIHDSLWPCPGDLPASVLAVWHLTIVEGRTVAQAISPDNDKTSKDATFISLPNGRYFGTILYADLDYGGQGSLVFDPVTWKGAVVPTDAVHALSNLTIDTSAEADYSVGNDAASSHVVMGHIDASFINLIAAAAKVFAGNPALGYIVSVKAGAATSIQQVSTLTPAPADPIFSEPTP